MGVPRNCPEYCEAYRLLKFIKYFVPVQDNLMLQLQQGSRRLWRAWLPPLLQKSSLQKLILT